MIISASRRTDIPAFYSDRFFECLDAGFVDVPNPMNALQVSRVSLLREDVTAFVFWTKNPAPMLPNLSRLTGYKFYFQFSLNAYSGEYERFLPPLETRIRTFCTLSRAVGKSRVVWRYDPIIFMPGLDPDFHAERFEYICGRLCEHTDTVVISFLDIYPKIAKNPLLRAPLKDEMKETALRLKRIADRYGLRITACCEEETALAAGIDRAGCIDGERIEKITGRPLKRSAAKPLRPGCGCLPSKDIGRYNTCANGCIYCYANTSYECASAAVQACAPENMI